MRQENDSYIRKKSGLDKIASTNVRRNYALVAKTVKKLKKPVEITVNGRADLIIMDPEIFEGLMNLIEEYQDELAVAFLKMKKTPLSLFKQVNFLKMLV